MIHDILLACLNLRSRQLPLEEFLFSDAVSSFFHPCEKSILQDIVLIINLFRESARFAKCHSIRHNIASDTSIIGANASNVETDEFGTQRSGLYLKALANGFDTIINIYYGDMAKLERRYLQNPEQSLLFIYQQLQVYEPLARFLRRLTREISSRKLYGCAIMQFLFENRLHGDRRIQSAISVMHSSVNVVFLRQLIDWVLYAKVSDPCSEFFIQYSYSRDYSTMGSERGTSVDRAQQTSSPSTSDTGSSYGDIWHFEICYELLPQYLPGGWAEKVLFIGQTVLLFKIDLNGKSHLWNRIGKCPENDANPLWNDKEHFYFTKMQALQNEEYKTRNYESVINEIKQYVTMRLSEVAIKQADLVQQLHLIKDFYLLGRGELYLEFIRHTYMISRYDDHNENKLLNIVKAFETAAHSVGVLEELDQFSLCVSKSLTDIDVTTEFGLLQHLQMQYNIHWPLYLFFSPKVIERYNVLFRFLLLIRRIQYELHAIWRIHTYASKHLEIQCVKILHLRNQLMFFIDNLQYYIQVDVLESQFSILLNAAHNKADFDQIQRAHSIFQANVLSLCFLLAIDDDSNRLSMMPFNMFPPFNPVYLTLDEIFNLCEEFCILLNGNNTLDGKGKKRIDALDVRFGNLMEQLISLLDSLKSGPSTTPLSQLLLRLDYNNWFSVMKKRQQRNSTTRIKFD